MAMAMILRNQRASTSLSRHARTTAKSARSTKRNPRPTMSLKATKLTKTGGRPSGLNSFNPLTVASGSW